jgi:ATP-binding cassette, subfamily F, member 3
MPLAQLTNIEKTFGRRTLFDKLNFTINPDERIGFIGANGSGKSTLFKVLTGHLVPDFGTVAFANSVKVGHLTQDPVLDPENTVIDEAELAFKELHDLAHQLRDLEHEMAHLTDEALEKILEKYQEVQHAFDLGGGYVWHHKLEATLQGVGLMQETWEQKVGTLSGGQRSRLALAKLLIAEPDLLLLDEPTNHLDLAAIEWLENYLLEFKGAAVIISHDRYLLDRLATRVVWLTRNQLNSYPGNYTNFVAQKELHELTQQRAYEEQQEDIEKQKEFVRRFGAGQRSKEAKGREKRLNRLLISEDLIKAVDVQKKINLNLSTDQRAGDRVLSVRELSKNYPGKQLWNELTFAVQRGERLGIIGPNGSGKTTLLKTLIEPTLADSGELKWGANLNIGYYDQRLDEFDPENTVFEEVSADRPAKPQEVKNLLGALLFRGDDIEKPIALLSGGERARVRLAQLLLDKPNVLMLDEPTNHLDIASCEALERTLADFPGTILCVSHDRYFLDHVVKRMLVLQPPNMVDFEGNYSAWTAKQRAIAKAAEDAAREAKKPKKTAPPPPKPVVKHAAKKDNPYARPFGRLTVQELEKEIASTEAAITAAQAKLADPAIFRDQNKVKNTQTDHDRLVAKLEGLEKEYFERNQ